MNLETVVVGSNNIVKIQAVEEVLSEWGVSFKVIKGIETNSGVSEQPLSLEEMIQGAKNRARAALEHGAENTLGIGIESGLMPALGTTTGYLEATICCFYDGAHLATGLSPGFEVPPKVLKVVLEQGMDLGRACHHNNIGGEPGLGKREGLVGLVTRGHISRKSYTKQAVAMALGQWMHFSWYKEAT